VCVCVCVCARAEFMALTVRSGVWAVLNTAILLRISCLLLKQESVFWSYKIVLGNGWLTLLYLKVVVHARSLFPCQRLRQNCSWLCYSPRCYRLLIVEATVQSQRILCVISIPAMAPLQLYRRNVGLTLLVISPLRSVICGLC
jgi:hypothetical protein